MKNLGPTPFTTPFTTPTAISLEAPFLLGVLSMGKPNEVDEAAWVYIQAKAPNDAWLCEITSKIEVQIIPSSDFKTTSSSVEVFLFYKTLFSATFRDDNLVLMDAKIDWQTYEQGQFSKTLEVHVIENE